MHTHIFVNSFCCLEKLPTNYGEKSWRARWCSRLFCCSQQHEGHYKLQKDLTQKIATNKLSNIIIYWKNNQKKVNPQKKAWTNCTVACILCTYHPTPSCKMIINFYKKKNHNFSSVCVGCVHLYSNHMVSYMVKMVFWGHLLTLWFLVIYNHFGL